MDNQKQTVKFGDICREVKLTTKNPLADGYDKYIGLEHLDSGSLKIKRWGSIAEDSPSFTRVFKKGHVLFGKRRSYLRKAAIAEFDGVCSGDIIVMEPHGELMLPELLPFIVRSESFWNWAIKTSSGSLSPRTKFKDLSEFQYLLPNLKSQIIILEILSKFQECFSATNEVIKSNESVLDTIIEKILSDSIIAGKVTYMTLPQLVTNTKNSLTAGPFGTIFKAKDFRESGIPIIQLRHVTKDGYFPENKMTYMDIDVYKKLHLPYTVKNGDLLITKLGDPPGICCIYNDNINAMVTPDVIKATIDHELALPEYLVLLYNSAYMRKVLASFTKGGTRPRVTLNEFYNIKLPILTKEQQSIIVEYSRSMKNTCNILKNKQSIFLKCMSGLVI